MTRDMRIKHKQSLSIDLILKVSLRVNNFNLLELLGNELFQMDVYFSRSYIIFSH